MLYNKYQHLLLCLLVFCLLPNATIFAETLYLKNGQTIEGKILEKTDKYTKIDFNGVELTYDNNEIEKIEESQVMVASGVKLPLAEFRSQDGAIKLSYPQGWFVQEGKTRAGYRVMITPQRPDPARGGFEPIVIDLNKYYNASVTMNLGEGTQEQLLDRYSEEFLKAAKAKIVGQEVIQVQSVSARLLEIEGVGPSGDIYHLFVLAVVRNGLLATLFCEAPPAEFDSYRELFRTIIEKLELFSVDPKHPDNAMPAAVVTKALKFTAPASWTNVMPESKDRYQFETSKDSSKKLIGYIKTFSVAGQSAAKWASDEAKTLETSRGMQITVKPQEIQAGDLTWSFLGWEGYLPYNNKQLLFKGEQYYLKDKETMIEVFLAAPKDIFGNVDHKEVLDFLASVRLE